jgi:hypothetical protein
VRITAALRALAHNRCGTVCGVIAQNDLDVAFAVMDAAGP